MLTPTQDLLTSRFRIFMTAPDTAALDADYRVHRLGVRDSCTGRAVTAGLREKHRRTAPDPRPA